MMLIGFFPIKKTEEKKGKKDGKQRE